MFHTTPLVRSIRTNLEETLILVSLGRIAFSNFHELSDTDQAVLSALRRSTSAFHNSTVEEIGDYLRGMDEDALPGVVSNTKGILHEMQFVELENEDGDSVYASIFATTNHPGTDVQFVDTETGATWEVQLKATDYVAYANGWVDNHPDGEILVTSELADRTDLDSSGLSNQELTEDVESLVDKMLLDEPDIWDYLPMVTTLTLANILCALWIRLQEGAIDWQRFKFLAAKASGIKVAKIAILGYLLSMPVVGQMTGAVLIAKFIISVRDAWPFATLASEKSNSHRLPNLAH